MLSVSGLPHGRAMADVAERQMRNWALDLQTRQRVAEESAPTNVSQLINPYIAISREAGVDAAELAGAIANTCGWKVFDRELLDYLAEHDHLSRLALEFVDEQTVSWFHEMFGKWLEEQLVSQAEYVSRLGRLVLLAAQHERSIFVGRGVQFMLPRNRGLAVRILAPLKQRVECLMKRKQCSYGVAKGLVAELDDNRAQFVRRYFHRDIADPHLYDLVVNLEYIPRSEAVELIATEAKRHEARVQAEASSGGTAA
jgi:cytidylate kinase